MTRGVDAEAQLEELLGGAGRFALLCADQGMPLASMTPLETGGAAFMSAIESEVESLADGSAARFIGERVKEQLAVLVTAHHGRPTGEYKSALDEFAKLERQRAEAQTRLGRAQQRLDELEALRNRVGQAGRPGSRAGARASGQRRAARIRGGPRGAREGQGGRPGCRFVRETSRRVETGARRLRPARRRTRQVAGRGR